MLTASVQRRYRTRAVLVAACASACLIAAVALVSSSGASFSRVLESSPADAQLPVYHDVPGDVINSIEDRLDSLQATDRRLKNKLARLEDAFDKFSPVPGPRGLPGQDGARVCLVHVFHHTFLFVDTALGHDGAAGMQGPPGAPGRDGPRGYPGIDGAPGPQGPAGAPGHNGLNGARGPMGSPGQDGRDGRPGRNGDGSVDEAEASSGSKASGSKSSAGSSKSASSGSGSSASHASSGTSSASHASSSSGSSSSKSSSAASASSKSS
jgi:hypothetical protein